MDQNEDHFISEVEKLKKVVQDNETIQEDVIKNIGSVEEELSQVEVLMKGMKTDILQYRYAVDGMTEYHKQLEIVRVKTMGLPADQRLLHRPHAFWIVHRKG